MTKERTTRGDGKLFVTPKYVESVGLGSARKIAEMCQAGTIKAVKVGRTWHIDRAALNAKYGIEI